MLTLEFVRAFIGEKMYARGMQEYTEAMSLIWKSLKIMNITN